VGQNAAPFPVSGPVESRPPAREADSIIRDHVIAAVGAGLVPSPVVDIVAVTLIEVNMITRLAKAYSFPVPHRLVTYKVLISLVGGVGPAWLGLKLQGLIKGVPLVGHALYVGTLSIFGGASVYAVGKLFQKHFESGGTFLSSRNTVLKGYYREKLEEGKVLVPRLLRDAAPSTS